MRMVFEHKDTQIELVYSQDRFETANDNDVHRIGHSAPFQLEKC